MTPNIEIVIIGYEILSGRTRDLNAVYMVDALEDAGFKIRYIDIIGDDNADIIDVFQRAVSRSDVVLVTGGLGPTSDDITVQALAEAFNRELILDEEVLEYIRNLFRRRKRFMSESNKKQALIPEGAEPIVNTIGSAPGILFERDNSSVYLMPGVPIEMRTMFDRDVLPRIKSMFQPVPTDTSSVTVAGISESELYDRIGHLPGALKAFRYYPGPDGIEIRIETAKDAPADASQLCDEVVSLLGDHVFTTSGQRMEEVVASLLIKSGHTVGVAESCTGGMIADRLTNVAGSSAYFLAGVVAYSNEAKRDVLGVDHSLIERHGAVSAEVAEALAEGIRKASGADIGISTTGIAGPGGGSTEKPVGLMFTGISTIDGTVTKKLQFAEDRLINKRRMSHAVLNLLRFHLRKL